MQIWFYKRECQLGDYVYADGSWSDRLNKSKTVVGVCFYIDPTVKTHRLCVAVKELDTCLWGLMKGDWVEGIVLNDDPSYNVWSVPTLNKPGNSGITGDVLTEALYKDPNTPDGFKAFSPSYSLGEIGWTFNKHNFLHYKIGDSLPFGQVNTIAIITHCQKILTDSNINLPLPSASLEMTEYEHLRYLMNDVVVKNRNEAKFSQYYYPKAYACFLYEPKVSSSERLAEIFQAHNWFLPSAGEMARIVWYREQSKEESNPEAIFANAIKAGVFEEFSNTYNCTSTEVSEVFIWGFYSNIAMFGNNFGKSITSPIRPVCAF